MALDTLEIFGDEFTNVTGIKATDENSNTLTYIRPQGTKSITSNGTGIDVAEYASVDVSVSVPSPMLQTKSVTYTPTTTYQVDEITADAGYDGLEEVDITVNPMPTGTATAPTSISGTTATVSTGTNTLTLTKTVSVTPRITTAGYVSSGTAGNSSVSLTANVTTKGATTYHPSTSNQTIASGTYTTGTQTINAVTTTNLTADNIKQGVVVQVGDSSDSDCVASVTGTYEGGGGSSKNAQTAQSTTRATTTSYTEVVALTCTKAGTYHVYWSTFRSSTSGTWGSQLYINDVAYGTAQTGSWSNHIQNIHLTSVSLTANADVAVRVRSRGSNYYGYVGTLTIIEA